MAKINFLGPMNRESIEVDINSLRDLREIFKDDKDLQEWLEICAVAVNDNMVNSLDTVIEKNDKISLLPPVCGG